MPTITIKKEKKTDIIVNENMRDYGTDPHVKKKAESARAFLKKHGVPKQAERKK